MKSFLYNGGLVYMKTIRYDNDESYLKDIKDIIKDFDSYEYIYKQLNIIVSSIDKDIKEIKYDDENYELHIYVYGAFYGFNYDYKNYPLISFYCEKLTISDIECIIKIDDDLIINLSMIDVENFEKIE